MKDAFIQDFYEFSQLIHKSYNYIDIVENSSLFGRMLNFISVQYPSLINVNIGFYFNSTLLFLIQPRETHFAIDISNVKLEIFEKLLLGKISCITFLISHIDWASKECSVQTKSTIDDYLLEWEKFENRVGYKEEDFYFSDDSDIARKIIQKERVLWCYNKSCTGKTFLGLNTLNWCNQPKLVFNPSFNGKEMRNLMLVALEFGVSLSLFFDDLQCDIDFAETVLNFVGKNKENISKRNLYIFITSWYSLVNSKVFSLYKNQIPHLETKPEKFISLMKKNIKNPLLLDICDDNLALINIALSIQKDSKTIEYNLKSLEQHIFANIFSDLTNNEFVLVHILAVLGTYEFETPIPFLEKFGSLDINKIKTSKIINNSIFLAHRSICNFVAHYIENLQINGLLLRKNIIKRYINYIDSSEKWKAILHIVGENISEELLTISPLWNLMYGFQKSLLQQSLYDPSWDNTPSSIYFVLSSMKLLGVQEDYDLIVNALCENYFVVNGEINICFEKLKTTYDFIKIKEKMIEEDLKKHNGNYECGNSIDLKIIHQNWLLGLLVGLKDILLQTKHEDIYLAAEKSLIKSQNVDGYWYPKRVPWITARILIGLAEAGYSIKDEFINSAVKYLLKQIVTVDYWEAHTGGWNNEYETTSLCLEALIKCGYDCENNAQIEKVIKYLKESSDIWMSNNYEIDGTTTACAIIKIEGIQNDLLEYINQLAGRNIHKVIGKLSELDYDKTQSCQVAQIAYYAMELCWYILEKDLPNLLDDFITRSEKGSEVLFVKKKIFISYSEDSANHIKRVKKIADFLKLEGFIVYFYADEPLGTNNIVFMQKISECDIILIIGTKKYFEKASEIKQGGVFFEENIISMEFMKSNYEKIIPLAFDSFDVSFPMPLGINKGMRVKKVNQTFLNTLSQDLKNKLM